jgi:hypothetical protein
MDHLDGALSVHAGSDADALVREVNARQAVVIDDTAAVLRRGTNPIRAVGVAARNAAAVNPATGCLIRCLATLAAAAVPVLADDTALRATGSRGRAWRTGVRAAAAEAVVAVMESATGVAPIAWSTLTGRARPAGMAVGGAAVRVVRARRGIWRTAGRVATAIDDGRGALQVAATVGTVRAAAGAVKRDAACSAATDPPRPTTRRPHRVPVRWSRYTLLPGNYPRRRDHRSRRSRHRHSSCQHTAGCSLGGAAGHGSSCASWPSSGTSSCRL